MNNSTRVFYYEQIEMDRNNIDEFIFELIV